MKEVREMQRLVQSVKSDAYRPVQKTLESPQHSWNDATPKYPLVAKRDFLSRAEERAQEPPKRSYIQLVSNYEPMTKERYLLNPQHEADPKTAAEYAFLSALKEIESIVKRRSTLKFDEESSVDIEDASYIVGALATLAELSPNEFAFRDNLHVVSRNARKREVPVYRAIVSAAAYLHRYPGNRFDPGIFYRAVKGERELLEKDHVVEHAFEMYLDSDGESTEEIHIGKGDLNFEKEMMEKNGTLPTSPKQAIQFEQQIWSSLVSDTDSESRAIEVNTYSDKDLEKRTQHLPLQTVQQVSHPKKAYPQVISECGYLQRDFETDLTERVWSWAANNRKKIAIALLAGAAALAVNQSVEGPLEYLWSR